MRLGATLYIRNSVEAVEFYKEAFDMTLGYHEWYPDGTFLHAELHRGGHEVFCVSESRNDDFVKTMLSAKLEGSRPTMSYGIDFDSEEEVAKAFSRLAEEGNVLLPLGSLPWCACCAEVVDKYGVYWYIYK